MARYTRAQVNEMLLRAGYKRQASASDLNAANKFGEKVFAKTRDKIFSAPQNNPVTETAAQPAIPSYQEFLQGAGSPYASLYSDATLNQDFNPYYGKQAGAEDYNRNLAEQDLGRAQAQTTEALSSTYNQRGIFGSGVYNKTLQNELGQLGQSFQREYGAGEYTPYSLRKAEIEQQRRTAIETARLSRQGQAYNAYQQQFYPALTGGI